MEVSPMCGCIAIGKQPVWLMFARTSKVSCMSCDDVKRWQRGRRRWVNIKYLKLKIQSFKPQVEMLLWKIIYEQMKLTNRARFKIVRLVLLNIDLTKMKWWYNMMNWWYNKKLLTDDDSWVFWNILGRALWNNLKISHFQQHWEINYIAYRSM